MYIGHYKSVTSSSEFFTMERDTLDFPTQVEMNSERYSLFRAITVGTPSSRNALQELAEKYNIPYNIEIKL